MRVPELLETPHLFLRRLLPSDIEPFSRFMSDPDSTRYMVFSAEQKTFKGAQAMVNAVILSYAAEEPIFVLAIALKTDNRYIGTLGASAAADSNDVEIFYTLLKEYRGAGYATEAVRRLLDYLFTEEQVPRIRAYVFAANTSSIRLAQRLGMTDAGDVERSGLRSKLFTLDRGAFRLDS